LLSGCVTWAYKLKNWRFRVSRIIRSDSQDLGVKDLDLRSQM
jgi:hypothetical protein